MRQHRVTAKAFQRGVGIVTAIILLVVLSALAVAMVTMHTAQQTSSALDVAGVHAHMAARAGAEWGVYRQRIDNTCAPATTFAMPAGTSISSFTVTVTCSELVQHDIRRFRVTATACNQPAASGCPGQPANLDYVQRVVDVRFGE